MSAFRALLLAVVAAVTTLPVGSQAAFQQPFRRSLVLARSGVSATTQLYVLNEDHSQTHLANLTRDEDPYANELVSNGTHVFWQGYYSHMIYSLRAEAPLPGQPLPRPEPALSDEFKAVLGDGHLAAGPNALYFAINGSRLLVEVPYAQLAWVTPSNVRVVGNGLPDGFSLGQFTYSDATGGGFSPGLYLCMYAVHNAVWRLDLGGRGWAVVANASGDATYGATSCATSLFGETFWNPISQTENLCHAPDAGPRPPVRPPSCTRAMSSWSMQFYPSMVATDGLLYASMLGTNGVYVCEVFAGNLTANTYEVIADVRSAVPIGTGLF